MADGALWYVVQTYSGYENTVSTSILKARENRHMEDLILETRIPMETVTEQTEKGERTYERKKMPGYVFVKMVMTDDTRQLVRNVTGCAGFLTMPEAKEGSKEMVPVPQPLSAEEVQRFDVERHEVVLGVKAGDHVKVLGGPLEGFSGTVEEVDADTKRVRVNVSMFGRETPVDLELDQIETIQED